ncbi:hypothetical protein NQ314_010002 [Rhamnusium bicolor]|uniref:DUF4817 domain-containing protein n=1 Tax=Rhamnusium bicolor TaxID=1586634 RepID=A0AAV8XWD3_9CUCU|nr:hypothetical protein NQ314_010002 [Rhamnusium bicolor]
MVLIYRECRKNSSAAVDLYGRRFPERPRPESQNFWVMWGEAQSCNSCGSECQSACGTRHFRTCCFNYLKKRSSTDPLPFAMDPSLRLELWLAKSRYPYFQQRNIFENSREIPSDANGNHKHDSQVN